VKKGVFICKCGGSINNIDFQAISNYIHSFNQIDCIKESQAFCLPEGKDLIKREIIDSTLDRVIIIGCSLEEKRKIFEGILKECGLSPQALTMVNIRERCAWVHQDKRRATEKAKRLIKAGISHSSLLKIFEEEDIPVNKSVLVVGGGIAGIEASLELSRSGCKVTLVEKEPELGGKVKRLANIYEMKLKPGEFLSKKIKLIKESENIKVLTSTEPIKIEGNLGNFTVKLNKLSEEITIKVGAIILSVGCQAKFMREDYGFDLSRSVITHLQLEKLFINGEEIPQTICFLLDFANKSSRISFLSALKNALLIKEKVASEVFILYRQMQVSGYHLEKLYGEAREKGIIFFKYEDSPEISFEHSLVNISVFDPLLKERVGISSHLLVVEEEIMPMSEFKELGLDSKGLYQEENIWLYPAESNRRGIFFAGECREQEDVFEVLTDARAVAGKVYNLLRRGKITVNLNRAVVEVEKCALCLNCIRSCPYEAIGKEFYKDEDRYAAKVDKLSCQGCGICSSICPAGAIQLTQYENEQIITECASLLTD